MVNAKAVELFCCHERRARCPMCFVDLFSLLVSVLVTSAGVSIFCSRLTPFMTAMSAMSRVCRFWQQRFCFMYALCCVVVFVCFSCCQIQQTPKFILLDNSIDLGEQ